jgi:hypothetical protein
VNESRQNHLPHSAYAPNQTRVMTDCRRGDAAAHLIHRAGGAEHKMIGRQRAVRPFSRRSCFGLQYAHALLLFSISTT